jgi:hypothetical protein
MRKYLWLLALSLGISSFGTIVQNKGVPDGGNAGDVLVRVGNSYQWAPNTAGTGISSPGASSNTAIMRWNGGAGSAALDSGILIDGTGNMTWASHGTGNVGSAANAPQDIFATRKLIIGQDIGLSQTTRPWQFRPGSTESGARGIYVHASGGNPTLTFGRINGTISAPSATLSGNQLFGITAIGYGTSSYRTISGDLITANAAQNWSSTAAGTDLFFRTVKNSTTSAAAVAKMTNNGDLVLDPDNSANIDANLLWGAHGLGSIGAETSAYPSFAASQGPKNVIVKENIVVGSSPFNFTDDPGWVSAGRSTGVAANIGSYDDKGHLGFINASDAWGFTTVVGSKDVFLGDLEGTNWVTFRSTGNVEINGSALLEGGVVASNNIETEGDVIMSVAGNGVQIKEGSNAKMGVATLVAGTATISNTSVTSSSRIFLTVQNPGGTIGTIVVDNISPGVGFDIVSASGLDTSTVAWEIKEGL